MSGIKTWFGRGLDQDWVDKANGFWSVLLLAACSFGAFFIRYISVPITCVTPSEFTGAQTLHAVETCFQQDTYNLPFPGLIPLNDKPYLVMSYHLWIPIILFIQALCFKIPNIIWTTCKRCITFNLDETVESLRQAQLSGTETRKSMFQDAARVVESLLKRNNVLLGILYLVVKLLYLINLIGQFIFVTIFFRNAILVKAGSFRKFDIEAYIRPLLARVVLCDFQVRQLSKVHSYTLQCTLCITDIYEKLYVFLWYWIFFLGVVTSVNLILWAGFLFIPAFRDGKISSYIKAIPGAEKDSSSITRFISGTLGFDGSLLLSMISENSSEMVAANLSQEMFNVFQMKDHPVPSTQPVQSTSAAAALEPGTESVPMINMNPEAENPEKPPIV